MALGAEAWTLRLVHAGFRMAREQERPWMAVHVEVPGGETAGEADQARVWLQEARDLGAETAWVRAATVSDGLLEAVGGRQLAQVVMGGNRSRGPWDRLEQSRAQDAVQRALGAPVVTLPLEPPSARSMHTVGDVLGVVVAIAALLGVCTIFASALFTVAGFPGIAPVYALGVGFIAHRWGRAFSIPATVAVMLVFAARFAAARFPYRPEDWTNGLYLAGALVLVQMVVLLVDRLDGETRSLRRRAAETLLVMLLGRALARCSSVQDVAAVLAERLQRLFQAQAWMIVPGGGDSWVHLPETGDAPACPRPSELLPQFGHGSNRVDPFEPLFLDSCSFVALAGPGGAQGMLQLRLEQGRPFPQESWGLLQSIAVQGALALERVRWLEEAQQARIDTESERLRNTLLGAVSHDLRTPLAAIQGAASSLLLPDPLPEATRMDLLAMIRDESDRLARLLGDLLELTRLQSETIRIQKEWQLLDEVVGSAVGRLEGRMGPLPIRVDLPEGLPLVPLEGALMEQVLINLLSNAHRHAPDSPVDLRAWQDSEGMQLEIADRGPGIPAEFHQRIFDKFFRMPKSLKDGGAGLGLAICGAIIKLHGGSIWVEDRPGGGARFRISLPMEGDPPNPPEAEQANLTLESQP